MLAAIRLTTAVFIVFLYGCATSKEKKLKQPAQHAAAIGDASFRQEISSLFGPSLLGGNRITPLINGDQIFPSMLGAIYSAKRTITFETYVFWNGEIAKQFAEALAERARAGVKVHVILDAQGAQKAGLRNLALMRTAGVQLKKYHTVFWLDPRRFNNRTHRKLLVIDGKVGFIGGVGIADLWTGNADSPKHWRDSHFRVEGPVVAQLQAAFQDNWLKTRGELLRGDDYFPPLQARGSAHAQVFGSSPREGSINVNLMYQLAAASATRTLKIENAYFVPDRQLIEVLCAAAQRGVKVEIIVPGKHIDQKMVRHASRARWKPLLGAGVKIYEYEPTMIHCKLFIADGLFTSVGSANFDNRSLRLNDEANMNVLDAGFAAEMTRVFENDKRSAREQRVQDGNITEVPFQAVGTATSPEL